MKINQNYIYKNYNFSFNSAKMQHYTQMGSMPLSVKTALDKGLEIYRLPVLEINGLKFLNNNAIKIFPATNMPNKGKTSAELLYQVYASDKGPVLYSYEMYLPQIVSDNKLCKAAYSADFAHEYQHYLNLKNSDNMYVNLYKNLKNSKLYSPESFIQILQASNTIIDNFNGKTMRHGIFNMFGYDGKLSCEKNYGLIRTPKEITEDTVVQSVGYKNKDEFISGIKNFKSIDILTRYCIEKSKKLSEQYYYNHYKTEDSVKKIIRKYLEDSFYDEYNSYYAQYKLCEHLDCCDYGAKYNVFYNKLLSLAFKA